MLVTSGAFTVCSSFMRSRLAEASLLLSLKATPHGMPLPFPLTTPPSHMLSRETFHSNLPYALLQECSRFV